MELVFHEISIVLLAASHNPSLLNPDFLKYNKIVPARLGLATPPICSEVMSQVVYAEGLAILSQSNQLIFTEQVRGRSLDDLLIAEAAMNYVRTIPHVQYTAAGTNPKAYATPDRAAAEVLLASMVAEGPWREFRGAKPVVEIQLRYPLADTRVGLSIKAGDKATAPGVENVILFAGNFHRDIKEPVVSEASVRAIEFVNGWRDDLIVFQELVDAHFLEAIE